MFAVLPVCHCDHGGGMWLLSNVHWISQVATRWQHWGPIGTITHDRLDLTLQGPSPPGGGTSLHRDPTHPEWDLTVHGPSTSDTWWPRLDTYSNLFTWGTPSPPVLTSSGYWNRYSWQADGTHPTGMLSSYIFCLQPMHPRTSVQRSFNICWLRFLYNTPKNETDNVLATGLSTVAHMVLYTRAESLYGLCFMLVWISFDNNRSKGIDCHCPTSACLLKSHRRIWNGQVCMPVIISVQVRGSKWSAGVTPEVNLTNPLHAGEEACKWGIQPGFETQGRHHLKSKTAVSVAPQKGLMSSRN